jgi:AcrR family transcriptional regulator
MDTHPKRRGTLDRGLVLAAAAAVADRGIDNVTMSAIAEELEVTPMAIYQYVENKAHLLRLLHDLELTKIEIPPVESGPWYERLRDYHLAVTDAMTVFPGLGPEAAPGGDEVARLLEGYVQILNDAGFSDRDAAIAYTGLYYLAIGAQHPRIAAGRLSSPAATPPEDPDAHPATARAAKALRTATNRELQTDALDTFVAGLRLKLDAEG